MPWLQPARGGSFGHPRRRRRNPVVFLVPLALLALVIAAAVLYVLHRRHVDDQRASARRYAQAWAGRDARAMWNALDPASRATYPLERFLRSVRAADRTATVTAVQLGKPSGPHGAVVDQPVAVRTRLFGTLRGTVALKVDGGSGVVWSPANRLPGLQPGERIRRRVTHSPHRAQALTRDGRPMASDPLLSPFLKGLEQRYGSRLAGRPGAELFFGRRLIARVPAQNGRPIRSTLDRRLQLVAQQALGAQLGGVAVVRPRDGSVLALAGIADSAPQPPGSTFKIVTLSGVLANGIAKASSGFPAQTSATLSGVRLANANNESCGGSLAASFANSCNSVFAPLGAKLGAKRLVAQAEAFGFNEAPRVPVAKPSTIPAASALRDDLAVGSSAIGQDKDLATPLQMASIGATIGEHGIRAVPRVVTSDPVLRRRAVSAKVAAQVRAMMIGVVQSGTGTAGAIPGVQVAGKTGTAELRFTGNGGSDPKNTDAWFVAFAPASHPRAAVAVMLVGAGFGGASAAPIARQVLAAALGR